MHHHHRHQPPSTSTHALLPGPVALAQRHTETLAQPPSEEEGAVFNIDTQVPNHSDRIQPRPIVPNFLLAKPPESGTLLDRRGDAMVLAACGTPLTRPWCNVVNTNTVSNNATRACCKTNSCALAERCCLGRVVAQPLCHDPQRRPPNSDCCEIALVHGCPTLLTRSWPPNRLWPIYLTDFGQSWA